MFKAIVLVKRHLLWRVHMYKYFGVTQRRDGNVEAYFDVRYVLEDMGYKQTMVRYDLSNNKNNNKHFFLRFRRAKGLCSI